MSRKLENFILERKGDFDDYEPSDNLWNNLEKVMMSEEKKQSRVVPMTLKYAAAAAIIGIVIATSLTYFNKNKVPDFDTGIVNIKPDTETTNPVINNIDSVNTVATNNQEEKTTPLHVDDSKIKYRPVKRFIKHENSKASIDNKKKDDAYQADYVIVNGKPVKSEEEAVKIAEESLNMLASNLSSGVNKMKNLKYMSVNF